MHEISNAHNDTVTGVIVSQAANALVSYSKDTTINVWSFTGANFPAKVPLETICDHEGKIRCSDVFESLLGTFDADGKITVRDLKNPQECLVTLNIANIMKNQHLCFCDGETFAVGNSTAVEFYNMEGKYIDMIDLEDKICFMAVQGPHLLSGNDFAATLRSE